MMKNKLFLSLAIFIISILVIPQVTLAAWWNPFSWKVFNRKPEVKIEQRVVATSTPSSTANLGKSTSSKTESSSNSNENKINISSEQSSSKSTQKSKNSTDLNIKKSASSENILAKNTGGGSVINPATSGPRPVNPAASSASIIQTSSADIQRIKEEIKEIEKQIEYAKSSVNKKPQGIEDQERVKEKSEKISKEQNSSSSAALALTYEQRHCPRVIHIEDSLGNHSDGDRIDVTLSAPTPKVITLRVDVKDPESRPVVFWWGTNFPSADLNQSIPTSSNTFNIDFSTRRIGYPANQVYIHFKNDHGYNCAGSFYNSDGEAIFSYMVYPQD